MKLMERYGKQVCGYEGGCRGELEVDGELFPFTGHFEAAQFSSGRFEVGVAVTRQRKSRRIPLGPYSSNLTFEGRSVGGWNIRPGGRVFFSSTGWASEILGFESSGETLSAEYFKTSLRRNFDGSFNKTRFLVSNLLWHGLNFVWLRPIELDVNGFHILIDPLDDYKGAADNLINSRGIEPTALVSIEASQGSRHALETFRLVVDDLMYVFRLVTGNCVDWYYGEGLDESTGEAVERIHHNVQSSPYSDTVLFSPFMKMTSHRSPKLDFDALVTAFFDESNHIVDKESLKYLINLYTGATGNTHYLESRGLLASTLTELIASRYAELRGKSDWIPEGHYKKEVLRELKETVSKLGLSETDEKQLSDNLIGGYRISLRRKFEILKDGLDLPLNEMEVGRLKRVRDKLVHEGTFGLDSEDIEDWQNAYNLMIYMVLISLCRFLGYKGDLPHFEEHLGVCL